MKQGVIFIGALLLCSHVAIVTSLSCRRYPYECTDPGPCAYGKVDDICGQCKTCAKGPGESCGGIWNIGGTCASNLQCTFLTDTKNRSQKPGVCVAA